MKTAPIPKDEEQRLASLHALRILDTSPEERFERITRLALRVFKVPISTLTLVDKDREWFKSCQGLPVREGPRAISFCGHALVERDSLVVPDTLKDERFRDNPMVIGEPHIRFYAGVPVVGIDGYRLGVFCIKDRTPREFQEEDRALLKDLAAWASLELQITQLQETLLMNEEFRQVVEDELKESRDVNKLVVGREIKMVELKREIVGLQSRLRACEEAQRKG
ncbi:MAG TPA: GAF domain-containing protein [Candidatus Baltobacteraceae bacterium]|jgi:GAF domain-containing protein|nr:GAF domain-containing protein [Candidatus Baltobacteraceae bacterium]